MKPAGWFAPLIVGLGAAFGASQAPDGLERVAETLGFAGRAASSSGPLADYRLAFLGPSPWSTAVAGALGVLLTYALFRLAAAWLQRRTRE